MFFTEEEEEPENGTGPFLEQEQRGMSRRRSVIGGRRSSIATAHNSNEEAELEMSISEMTTGLPQIQAEVRDEEAYADRLRGEIDTWKTLVADSKASGQRAQRERNTAFTVTADLGQFDGHVNVKYMVNKAKQLFLKRACAKNKTTVRAQTLQGEQEQAAKLNEAMDNLYTNTFQMRSVVDIAEEIASIDAELEELREWFGHKGITVPQCK